MVTRTAVLVQIFRTATRPSDLTAEVSAPPQFSGWLRNSRSMGVSLPTTEFILLPNLPPAHHLSKFPSRPRSGG
jgi:hypothetical protein